MNLGINSSYFTLLLNRLGRRNDTSLRESAVDEVNMAMKTLESGRFLPWFLEKSMSPKVQFISGVTSTALPTDFLREVEDREPELILVSDSTMIRVLSKGTFDVLRLKYLNVIGAPSWYAISEGRLHLFPAPEETWELNLSYYARQAPILDDGNMVTNPWLLYAADWLLAEAGGTLAAFHIIKPELAVSFARAAATARDGVVVLHESRMHANMNYSDDSEYARSV